MLLPACYTCADGWCAYTGGSLPAATHRYYPFWRFAQHTMPRMGDIGQFNATPTCFLRHHNLDIAGCDPSFNSATFLPCLLRILYAPGTTRLC